MQKTELPGFDLPPSPAVTAINDLSRATFGYSARKFVLEYLRRQGPTSGEDLTDAMLEAGITPPGGNDKTFGAIYQAMRVAGHIERYGVAMRRKGNGTLGATIWKTTAKGLQA